MKSIVLTPTGRAAEPRARDRRRFSEFERAGGAATNTTLPRMLVAAPAAVVAVWFGERGGGVLGVAQTAIKLTDVTETD